MIEEILERLQTRPPRIGPLAQWTEAEAADRFSRIQRARLRYEGAASRMVGLNGGVRVMATACWDFPIYSQTFVYQELSELARLGFDLRFLYSNLNPRSYLPPQFDRVWKARRKLVLHHTVCERDYEHYRERMPERIESLIDKICSSTGMSPGELRGHHHFKQAFAFTRTVEACRPDYLHSYFFYEGTLFSLFASWLLNIPRGVSCYADHMLQDYVLKLVPFHLEQCRMVIATSGRIKRELMELAPRTDPDKILVKPNAIDVNRFPVVSREEPEGATPYRLACVSRIEPKKGILYLVDAVHYLRSRGIDVSAHVLGGVDDNEICRNYAQSVDARIRELGVGDAIHREGRRPASEIRRFLENSHLFVAPFIETETGDKDGIPTALLEAMATGLPAVATDAGSIAEVIDDGLNGVIVPQRDGESLGKAIAALLADAERRRRMAKEAAEKIRRCFDVAVCEGAFHARVRSLTQTGARSR